MVGGGGAALGLQVLLLEVTVSDLVTKESEGPREYATSMLRPCSPEVYLKASAVFVGFGSDAELRMVPPRPRAKLSSWTWITAAESRSVSEASPRASKVARRIEFFSMPALLVSGGSGIASLLGVHPADDTLATLCVKSKGLDKRRKHASLFRQ